MGSQPSALRQYTWDGKSDAGPNVVDGVYTFTVTAKGRQGNTIQSTLFMGGLVEAIEFEGAGSSFFIVGDLRIDIGDVVRVSESGQR